MSLLIDGTGPTSLRTFTFPDRNAAIVYSDYLVAITGPTAARSYAFPDVNCTILTSNAAVTPAQGGTGIASYAVGDLLYASGATTLSKLADVAVGSVLVSGGVTTAPAWSATPALTSWSTTAANTLARDGIAVTSTDGLIIQNSTAATSGVPVQMSSRVRFRSNVWNTLGVANNSDDWVVESVPISGTQPSGTLMFRWTNSDLSGAAGIYATKMVLSSGAGGFITLGTAGVASYGNSAVLQHTGALQWSGRSILRSAADGRFSFSNANEDAGFQVNALTAHTLLVRKFDNSGDGHLAAASVRGNEVAFASLPTGVVGMMAGVSDSTTATWGATITGGGANHVLAYFNGTNWTVAGK